MINLCINNEFSRLKKVVLGISNDFGGCPSLLDAYDPKSKQHIINQTFPLEKNIEVITQCTAKNKIVDETENSKHHTDNIVRFAKMFPLLHIEKVS